MVISTHSMMFDGEKSSINDNSADGAVDTCDCTNDVFDICRWSSTGGWIGGDTMLIL